MRGRASRTTPRPFRRLRRQASPFSSTAPWCPTCKQQRPIVQAIEKERPDLVVYEVDFDTAKDVLKQFRVQYQSTLIAFKGSKEVARSTGETDPAPLRALVAKAF